MSQPTEVDKLIKEFQEKVMHTGDGWLKAYLVDSRNINPKLVYCFLSKIFIANPDVAIHASQISKALGLKREIFHYLLEDFVHRRYLTKTIKKNKAYFRLGELRNEFLKQELRDDIDRLLGFKKAK